MSQSRRMSMVEAWASTFIGLGVAMILNAVVLPAYGYPVTASHNFQIAAIFTVASIIRSYVVRRMFVRFFRG